MDGFGTLHPLRALRAAGVDVLKLAPAFGVAAVEDEHAARILAALTALGRELGTTVVVPGADTPQIVAATEAAGATYYQGRVFGPPLTSAEVVLRLACSGTK